MVEGEALCLLVLFGMFTLDQTRKGMAVEEFNPSAPRSDKHVASPYNILTSSSKQVMRIFKVIG